MSDTVRRDRDHLVLWTRIAIGIVLGVVAGWLIPLPAGATRISHILLGFVVAGLVFALPLLMMAMRLDAAATVDHVDGLGESFQVSDQTMNTAEVRKIVFFHTLLSYVLGTGIVATTINLVAGLAG